MKKLCSIKIFYFLFILASCQKASEFNSDRIAAYELVRNNVDVGDFINGYFCGLPSSYSESLKSYPLLYFIHGSGQVGRSNEELEKVLFGGIPKILSEGNFPGSFRVYDTTMAFIVIAPQFISPPNSQSINRFLDYICKIYRIDKTRIYLTGLSAGSRAACDVASENPHQFAALICMAGVSTNRNVSQKAKSIREGNLPTWIFQNQDDQSFPFEYSQRFYSLMVGVNSEAEVRFTEFQPMGLDGHDAWTTASDPDYKEDGKNIYEWMLQFKR